MTSRNSSTNGRDNNGGNHPPPIRPNGRQSLIDRAVTYSRITRNERAEMRHVLREVDRVGRLAEHAKGADTLPDNFVEQLRRPVSSRRQTIAVIVDGDRIPLLLNPQGRADPEREAWLWEYICRLVREGVAG